MLLTGVFSLSSMAGHLGGELLVTAKLTGDQEVPAVTTDAVGLASFTISEHFDSVYYNIVVNNLSGPITGIHIHDGMAGTNGGVLINLSNNVRGTQIIGSIPSSDVDEDFIAGLLSEQFYVNVHTDDNPGGEIRGQLKLETDYSFYSSLDTMQQNHPVTNNASGAAIFDVSIDKQTLNYYVVTDGLSGDITAAHFHNGMLGQAGTVALDLSSGIDGTTLNGSISISSYPTLLADIMSGNIYINVHTSDNPNGEIRGQVYKTAGIAFDSRLTTDQETTTVIGSDAIGTGHIALNPTMDTLWYSFLATELSGSITGAHLHEAVIGMSGNVVLDLSSGINGNWIEGMATGSDITHDLVEAMLGGAIYINVHTTLNPNGETRGQIYRTAREGYTFNLTGLQEVPSTITNGYGVGIVSIDRDQSNAHYMIVVDQLSGPITGAHFHNAVAGMNGNVVFNLSNSFEMMNNYDAAFGYWTGSSSTAFTTASSVLFRNEAIYINIHTDAYANGEIRGQADRGLAIAEFEDINNGMLPMDPMFEGGLLYTARLSGSNEVPSVNTNATGVAGLIVASDFSKVNLNLTFDNLSSDLTGIHIHEGAAGTNGSVVVDLMQYLNSNQVNAELTELEMDKLAQGMYYINIHSEDFPNGEIRAQLMLETETSFLVDLNGGNEVPAVTTDASGLAHFYLTNNNTELRFKVVFDELSGPVTGAHLHAAAEGMNGSVVSNLTTMVDGNTIMGSVDPSSFMTELMNGEIYLNVHTSANADGEIRGQLNMADGYVYESWMNGAQAVPYSSSPAMGLALFELNFTMDSMQYWVQTSGLSDVITAIHLHNGELGVAGGVAVNLSAGIMDNVTAGVILEADISTSLISSLNSGDIYVNTHSLAFLSGEIRGQVYRMARDGYAFDLCGNQEMPMSNSTGYGSAILSIDKDRSFMHTMMVSTNFGEEVNAAHIHEGAAGTNGNVLFALNLSGSNYFAYDDSSAFDTGVIRVIKEGNAYINVHTDDYPNGAIRGQIDNTTDCPTAPATLSIQPSLEAYQGGVYPNPVNQELTIDLGNYNQEVTVEVYNALGERVILQQVVGSDNLDFNGLTAGVYTVVINGEALSINRKVIKL
ncbi:CHRD domain-containing protein [bacterium]|nr:CHRD domain-containing protein [bacterium]